MTRSHLGYISAASSGGRSPALCRRKRGLARLDGLRPWRSLLMLGRSFCNALANHNRSIRSVRGATHRIPQIRLGEDSADGREEWFLPKQTLSLLRWCVGVAGPPRHRDAHVVLLTYARYTCNAHSTNSAHHACVCARRKPRCRAGIAPAFASPKHDRNTIPRPSRRRSGAEF